MLEFIKLGLYRGALDRVRKGIWNCSWTTRAPDWFGRSSDYFSREVVFGLFGGWCVGLVQWHTRPSNKFND